MELELRTSALARNANTVDEVKAQVAIIHKIMKQVMQKGVHYGTIPGCGDKPTLLKPGAEVIMTTFRLAAHPKTEETMDHDSYRVMAKVGIVEPGGRELGDGVGECSSDEDKYKWRRPVCDEEWNETDPDRRREKWIKKDGKPLKMKQVRTAVADVRNTVLKMAKKRALIDAILTCTAASDIFTQDIEDMPEGFNGTEPTPPRGKPPVKPPQAKSAKEAAPAPTHEPPQQQKQESKQNDDDEIRVKLNSILIDLAGGPDLDMTDLVQQYSSFKGSNGEIKAASKLEDLKGAWLRSTYGKAKKDHQLAGFGIHTAEKVQE